MFSWDCIIDTRYLVDINVYYIDRANISKFGVVSDKIAQLSATPYKREILLLLLLLRRRRRRLLLLLRRIIIIIGDARGRVKVVANPGNRDRV